LTTEQNNYWQKVEILVNFYSLFSSLIFSGWVLISPFMQTIDIVACCWSHFADISSYQYLYDNSLCKIYHFSTSLNEKDSTLKDLYFLLFFPIRRAKQYRLLYYYQHKSKNYIKITWENSKYYLLTKKKNTDVIVMNEINTFSIISE